MDSKMNTQRVPEDAFEAKKKTNEQTNRNKTKNHIKTASFPIKLLTEFYLSNEHWS